MRRAISILVVCAGCNAGTSGPPTAFGVNVTVDATNLTSSTLKQAAKADLFVSGAETFQTTFDIARPIQDGRMRFRYVPGVTLGTLSFYLEVKTASGTAIAGGSSDDVELVAGRAVEALIELEAGAGNGTACSSGDQCISGHCADEVCCDQTCLGLCESCALAGQEGKCSPLADGEDPDNECLPASAPEDGGAPPDDAGDVDAGDSDAGQAPAARVPDGGVMADPKKCKGTCNGARGCKFPNAQTSCGSPFCSFDDQMVRLTCDGEGRCLPEPETCVAFSCGPDACKTVCTSHADCLPTHFCDGATQKCAPKKGNGVTCGVSNECQSSFCVPHPQGTMTPVCCNTECNGTGMSCHDTTGGNLVGQCKCQGVTCAAGVACQLYYYDGDRDTYGDKSATEMNGNVKPACAGMDFFCTAMKTDPAASPVPCTGSNHRWEADKTDCRDDKPLVHPGQSGWFSTEIDPGSDNYDYNCSTQHEKEVPEYPGASCKFCEDDSGIINMSLPSGPRAAPLASFSLCIFEDKCDKLGEQSALDCCSGRYFCGSSTFYGCEPSVTAGFVASVPCGTTVNTGGSYVQCRTCLSAGGFPQSPNRPSKTQRCH